MLSAFTDKTIKVLDPTQNYKLLKYDLVLTSPPYWNLETYGDEIIPFKNKQQWIDQFYNPIFRNTFNNLDIGGHYCLNVNKEIYERVCIPLMGEATEKIPLCIEKRGNYMEYIYIWKKNFSNYINEYRLSKQI